MGRGFPVQMTRSKRWNPVATAVIQFAVTGTLAVLLLGFLAVTLLKHTGTDEAVNQAREITRLAARGVVAPNLTPALERGDPKAIAQMDRVVRRRVLEDPVVRIKVWDRTGRIVYSDDHRLIGSRYPLGEDDAAAFRNGATEAEVSDLSRPENRFERPFHKLLGGLPGRDRHPRPPAPLRVLPAIQLDLGQRPSPVAEIPSGADRRSGAARAGADPAGVEA